MPVSFRQALCVCCLALPFFASPASAQDYGSSYGAAASVNLETRLSSVEDQIRNLTGKVEQLEYAIRRLDQAFQRNQTDLEARISKLENAPPPAPVAAAAQPAAKQAGQQQASGGADDEDPTGTLGALKMRGNKVTGGTNSPKAAPLPETPSDYGLTPQEQYDRAFGLLRQASYDDAEKAFRGFIDKNPQDKLLDNAKYWYAETFYVRAKFGDAAVAFAEAFEQNPKGTKAPDSLLKLAMSLSSLNKTEDACSTLAALKAKFPNAPATIRTRAEQERSRMKCGQKPG